MKVVLLALGFMLVFEGLMPMIAPEKWQMLLKQLSAESLDLVRKVAMAMICLGLMVVWLVMELL